MGSLLSSELSDHVNDQMLVRTLEIPSRGDLLVPKVFPGQLISRGDILTKSYVLDIEQFPDGQELAIVDKAQPHAHFDFMTISSGDTALPGLAAHNDEFLGSTFDLGSAFAEFADSEGFSPVVAWSYDPLTLDRPSGQGEKRFHAHFMARTPGDVEAVAVDSVRIGDVDPYSKRRITEESSTVAALVLSERLESIPFQTLEVVPALSTNASSVSLQLELANGWKTLEDPDFITDFRIIDQAITELDADLREAILNDPIQQGNWERSELHPDYRERAEELSYSLELSSVARNGLTSYVSGLRPGVIRTVEANREHLAQRDIVHRYPLAGISYTTCISETEGRVNIYFRYNVFSDLGGAGTSIIDGVPVKIKKGNTIMSQAEITDRNALQRHFLEEFDEHKKGVTT